MVSAETRNELEETLGGVPSFISALSPEATDHSWGIVRDFELGETELSMKEKALIGVGVAAALQCPYCVHFHKAEATLGGATEAELAEAGTIAATTRYFSTALHSAEIAYDDFVTETAEMVAHIEQQQAARAD